MQLIPLRLTASAIADFSSCEHRYARLHLIPVSRLELSPVTLLSFGETIHRCVAKFFQRGGWASVDEAALLAICHRKDCLAARREDYSPAA